MQTKIIKIQLPNENFTFSQREKLVNEKILKLIEEFKKQRLYTKQHEVLNRTVSFYSVRFTFN
jgi:hypothetical protein